ncbi:hypothetical protein [Caulobacter sp. 17J80-11]|uniref:hypothetical protein n=1 Tax=Caulobacter sp. 17J80-11 TaxID=2763502 RepID=UPI0021023C0A|nr:hypothetical protein [Caulobacter sp. 17J80-11]
MTELARFSVRPLTAGERRLADEVFGQALDCDPVRIWAPALPLLDRAFVPGRLGGRSWIVWPWPSARADFAEAPLRLQATFVHELVHVWQAQRGVLLPLAKLKAGDAPRAYRYRLDGPGGFTALNIEQQAMAVEHDFLRRRGGEAPFAAELYEAALPFRRTAPPERRA